MDRESTERQPFNGGPRVDPHAAVTPNLPQTSNRLSVFDARVETRVEPRHSSAGSRDMRQMLGDESRELRDEPRVDPSIDVTPQPLLA
jgi:hypothetical protein